MTLTNFLLIIGFVAGISHFWAVLLNDHPGLKSRLKQKSKLFVCGACQTFWLSLLAVIVLDPLGSHEVPVRLASMEWASQLVNFALAWLAIALAACVVRYVAQLTIEALKYMIRRNAV